MAKEALDLGFCPKCKDSLQPCDPKGYPSMAVDGVLFCVHCAVHLAIQFKQHTGRERLVQWAKDYAKNTVSEAPK